MQLRGINRRRARRIERGSLALVSACLELPTIATTIAATAAIVVIRRREARAGRKGVRDGASNSPAARSAATV
jgi:hypothetical protein